MAFSLKSTQTHITYLPPIIIITIRVLVFYSLRLQCVDSILPVIEDDTRAIWSLCSASAAFFCFCCHRHQSQPLADDVYFIHYHTPATQPLRLAVVPHVIWLRNELMEFISANWWRSPQIGQIQRFIDLYIVCTYIFSNKSVFYLPRLPAKTALNPSDCYTIHQSVLPYTSKTVAILKYDEFDDIDFGEYRFLKCGPNDLHQMKTNRFLIFLT